MRRGVNIKTELARSDARLDTSRTTFQKNFGCRAQVYTRVEHQVRLEVNRNQKAISW